MRKRFLGAILIAALFGGCAGSGTESVAEQAPEETAPATAPAAESNSIVNTIDGGQVDLAEVIEQDAVLWFWAPW